MMSWGCSSRGQVHCMCVPFHEPLSGIKNNVLTKRMEHVYYNNSSFDARLNEHNEVARSTVDDGKSRKYYLYPAIN